MANDFNNSRLTREFSHVFLNSEELSGVQSCSLDFKDIIVPIKHLGMTNPAIYPLGARNGQATINYIPITNDLFLPYTTGNNGFNLYVMKSRNETGENYSLESGYINTYNSKCSIGGLPDVTVGISVLGDIGRISGHTSDIINHWTGITGNQYSTGISNLATFSSIDIDMDGLGYNRVTSYELAMNITRNPVYAIGNQEPISVDINYPIEVLCNINLDMNDYQASTLGDYPCKSRVSNLSISLKDYQTYQEYIKYSFNNLILVGQNYVTNVNGNTTLALQYKTYIGRPTGGTLPALPECTSFTGTTGVGTNTDETMCPTGDCILNSGITILSSELLIGPWDVPKVMSRIVYNGIDYGSLIFSYSVAHALCSTVVCLTPYTFEEIIWNYDYDYVYPNVGTWLIPPGIVWQCPIVQPFTFPFIVKMKDCELNLCVVLPAQSYCPPDPSTTTTTTTTTPTTTTTTTPTTTTTTTPTTTTTTTPTTTTTTTPTTTTTTTTPTTTTTTTSTTTTTPTTTTTTTTTTSTTTPPPPPCIGCDGYDSTPIMAVHYYGIGGGECGQISIPCNLLGACSALTSLTPETSPLCIETPTYAACWSSVVSYLINSCHYSFTIGACSSADPCQTYVSISVP